MGRGAQQRTGPLAPSRSGSRGSQRGPRPPRPRVVGPLQAPRPLCYGGAASTPSGRRVSAASSYCRNSPAPSYCRVCAGPGPPGQDSSPLFGGRGVSAPPSRLRDAPGPGGCGFIPTPGDCLIPVARGGRSAPEAAGSRRFPVAPSHSRDSSVAGDCRVSTGPGRWGGSGLRASPGRPARPQAR